MEKAAIYSSKLQLNEAMAELESSYAGYRQIRTTHPMYLKEWNIFYLRTLSNLLAGTYSVNVFFLEIVNPNT